MKSQLGNPKTESDLLFEEYLVGHGYPESDWDYEEPVPGKSTTPDYCLRFQGAELYFDVKEFAFHANGYPTAVETGQGGPYNPYPPLREKINQAARQFKPYKEFSCSLVLANPHGAPLVHLDDPGIVAGAMMGNAGIEVPIGGTSGFDEPLKQVFMGGGRMIDEKRRQPQNTTISSIVVLSHYHLRQKRMEIAFAARRRELSRELTPEEAWELDGSFPATSEDDILRVVVYENPYARIPLSRDLFRGPFDARRGGDGRVYRRIYVGDDLRRVEEELARLRSPDID